MKLITHDPVAPLRGGGVDPVEHDMSTAASIATIVSPVAASSPKYKRYHEEIASTPSSNNRPRWPQSIAHVATNLSQPNFTAARKGLYPQWLLAF